MTYKRIKLPANGNWICRRCGSGNYQQKDACVYCGTEKENLDANS